MDRFMPGESAEDALAAAERMVREDTIPVTFTRLGENTTELYQAAEAAGDYLRLLDRIEELGLDAEISVKLTQLGYDQDPGVTATHVERLVDRSAELGRTCWIDMESSAYVDGTIDLYEAQLHRDPHVGLCLQAYLRRTYDDIQRLLPAGPTVRLVKGAYREPKELAFSSKTAIDESYLRLAQHLVKGGARRVALGSHDTDLIALIDDALSGHDGFEVAMLYGIRTDAQRQLTEQGFTVRTLISYGPSWYPWFMRRIAEKPAKNTLLALRNLV
jgi:proline dehydrogenase